VPSRVSHAPLHRDDLRAGNARELERKRSAAGADHEHRFGGSYAGAANGVKSSQARVIMYGCIVKADIFRIVDKLCSG
jgi:hypothetical protein